MIASRSPGAYFAGMVLPRLMRVLTLLAVLLAPLAMMSSHAQAAAPAAVNHVRGGSSAMPGHCPPAGEEQDKQKPAPNIDCTIMCSAMPAPDAVIPAQPALTALDLVQPLGIGGYGLNPEADPPPPRLS